MSDQRPARADVLQGTLDIMILQTLATLRASYGYAIAARLEQVSGGRVQLNMGTLHPGLMRLEQRGFITVTWGGDRQRAPGPLLRDYRGRPQATRRREAGMEPTVTIMQALLSESK